MFDQIFGRVFDQSFGQIFDQVFGQGLGSLLHALGALLELLELVMHGAWLL